MEDCEFRLASALDESTGVRYYWFKTPLSAAKHYLSLGLKPIPLAAPGERGGRSFTGKEPLVKWEEYQTRQPTEEEVERWFAGRDDVNLGIVCGFLHDAGGRRMDKALVVVDFDDEEAAREFSERLRELGLNPETWVVRTGLREGGGHGWHVYFLVDLSGVGEERARELVKTRLRVAGKVDVKGEGGYVVAPPSVHKSGARYVFYGSDPCAAPIHVLGAEEWARILSRALGVELEKTGARAAAPIQRRRLSEAEAARIVEALRPFYIPGFRDLIAFYLSGWLAKAGVAFESARLVVEKLAEGDEEKKKRIEVVEYTYGLRGAPKELDRLKGRSGLEEILVQAAKVKLKEEGVPEAKLDEEAEKLVGDALRELEDVLGPSPYRDMIIAPLSPAAQLYAVASFRNMMTGIMRRVVPEGDSRGRLVWVTFCLDGVPSKVGIYRATGGNTPTEFYLVWESRSRPRPLEAGPLTLGELYDVLRAEGLVINERRGRDVFFAVINAIVRRGRAELLEEVYSGFFWHEGRLVAQGVEVSEPDPEELRELLAFLDLLARKYYSRGWETQAKFSAVLKYGLASMFGYALKQMGNWMPALYLYGTTRTGKSTLGEIILYLWGRDPAVFAVNGASADTKARLGHWLGDFGTGPVVINEADQLFEDENLSAMLKSAIEGLYARGRYVMPGAYRKVPALSTLIFTSNRPPPSDAALLRRLFLVHFGPSEQVSEELAEEWHREVKPRLPSLRLLGQFAAGLALREPGLLELGWLKFGEEVLRRAYEYAGLGVPEWVGLSVPGREEEDERTRILISLANYIKQRGLNEYSKHVWKAGEARFEDIWLAVVKNNLLGWLFFEGDARPEDPYEAADLRVVITSDFVEELRSATGIKGVTSLKDLAELLGWEYARITLRVGKKSVIRPRVVRTTFGEFLAFLSGRILEKKVEK